jgi:hypothetical protein
LENYLDVYKRTFVAYSGCDIHAMFDGTKIGELQAITYSVAREKTPTYVLGSPDPVSFGRGKRAIAGSLIFSQFDREALLDTMLAKYQKNKKAYGYQSFVTNLNKMYQNYYAGRNQLGGDPYAGSYNPKSLDELGLRWREANDRLATQLSVGSSGLVDDYSGAILDGLAPEYVDQLMPFNISILFTNEYGAKSRMEIIGVEIINEGMGFSVDDVQIEKAMTFVARRVQSIRPFDTTGKASSSNRTLLTGGITTDFEQQLATVGTV